MSYSNISLSLLKMTGIIIQYCYIFKHLLNNDVYVIILTKVKKKKKHKLHYVELT